jgi:hypothetical protein
MKTKLFILAGIISLFALALQAQNRTYVNALNTQISDNLDLRAVASIFGESQNLSDFERRLNDPIFPISNLDLNNDNQVDYLRVVESVKNQTHLVVIQAVLDRYIYQDIATIDVERDAFNKITIQLVGNTHLYGSNCIYEPIYYSNPRIFSLFWASNYRPYSSTWSWNYYPKHYYSWSPYPAYRYRKNIANCLNANNRYHQVDIRSSRQAEVLYRRNYSYSNSNYSDRNFIKKENYTTQARRSNSNTDYRKTENRSQYRSTNNPFNTPNQREQRRETSEKEPLQIRNVELDRHKTQYVDTPNRNFSDRDYFIQNTDNQIERNSSSSITRRN